MATLTPEQIAEKFGRLAYAIGFIGDFEHLPASLTAYDLAKDLRTIAEAWPLDESANEAMTATIHVPVTRSLILKALEEGK